MAYVTNKNKIVKNTMALYIRMGLTMLISFFATRITLQVLGVTDYGLYNLVAGVISLFSFLYATMGTAVQRFLSISIGGKNDAKLHKVFGVSLYLHILIAVITLVLLEIFAFFFLSYLNIPAERYTIAQLIFQISSFSLFLTVLSVPYSALLRAREEYAKMSYIEIAYSIVKLLNLYFLCIIEYDKLVVLSILNFVASLCYMLSLVSLARRYAEANTSIVRDKELIKEMFQFISLLFVTVLTSLVRDQGIIIVINMFFGLTVNAAYAIAMQVMALVNTFVLNFKQSIIPQMMAAYGAGDTLTMKKLITIGTKVSFLLLALISIPVAFEVDFLLEFWLKTPPEHTSNLVVLVLININIASFTYFLYQGVHAVGKISLQQIAMSILYILNIVLIWIFLSNGASFYTALYVTIGVSAIQCLVDGCCAKKIYRYSLTPLIKIILKSIFIVFVTCLSLYWLRELLLPSWWRLILLTGVSTILILSMGYILLLDAFEKKKVKITIHNLRVRFANKVVR